MDDAFYQKFPSFKNNQKLKKAGIDYKEYLKTNNEISTKSSIKKTKIPLSKPYNKDQQQYNDIFSVEERNKNDEKDSREKQINYQKVLLEQIEEAKLKKKMQKEKEQENEKKLEERLEKQIQSMNIQNNDPVQNRVVERVSVSENDKYRYQQKRNNDVYRYFSKSSMSLFNYKDRYFNDLDMSKNSQEGKHFVTNCTQCHKKVEILCSDCKHDRELNDSFNLDKMEFRTNLPNKMLKFSENYAPYTFDNSSRLQKNALDDLRAYDYFKLYNELKRNKKVEKVNRDFVKPKKDELNLEELISSNPQQYTVITGYAKSLLGKTEYLP